MPLPALYYIVQLWPAQKQQQIEWKYHDDDGHLYCTGPVFISSVISA